MKKNPFVIFSLAMFVITHFGFEWGNQSAEKKSTAQPSASVAKRSNLPFSQMMGALAQNMTLWPVLDADNKKKSVVKWLEI